MFVTKRNGKIESIHFDKITERISKLINNEERHILDPIIIAQKVVASIYTGITTEELDLESANICINLCTTHHLYSSLASRILVSNLHKKTFNSFVEKENLIQDNLNILNNSWLEWINKNKEEINNMIDYNRDYIFDYFGFKTLERAYLIKIGNKVIERPQDMFMRVASFINQGNLELVKKTYDLMSYGYYTHASPTLFNAGNKRSQNSSCFLLGTDDSIDGITKTWADVSKISKWGGGIGLHVSNIRGKDSLIRGTNGPSSGIIPMLKVYNEIARYVDQCFIGDTRIYTNEGIKKIKNIGPNDKVITINGSMSVTKVYNDQYNGQIINLIINNENISVTPSHPFLILQNSDLNFNIEILKNKLDKKLINVEWIESKDIKVNDFSVIPIPTFSIDNLNYDEEDCFILGILLINNRFISDFSIYTSSKKIIDTLIQYFKKYDIKITIQDFTSNVKVIKWEATSKFKFNRSIFLEKNIHHSILNLPKEKIEWVLKGIEFTETPNIREELILGIKFMNLKLGKIYNSNTEYFVYDNCIFVKISDISRSTYNGIVYDLEVAEEHNYLTSHGLVHNGGKRKGSIAIYLEPHHSDILSFLDLKKNFGAETERARDLFLAVWVSDLFMKQVEIDGDWYLMCPDTCRNLSDVYGDAYEKLYWEYVNENKYRTKVKAREVMKAILDSQLETGTPYILYKDHINKKSNQKNLGVIKSSNLCAEIVQYSDHKEYAVCNLASIAINKFIIPWVNNPNSKWKIYTKDNCNYCNWAKKFLKNNNINFEEIKNKLPIISNTYPQIFCDDFHIGGYDDLFEYTKASYDYGKLYEVAYIATRNLDSIIDSNYYPVEEAKLSNLKHRPIGLGIQGLADALVLLRIPFDSEESLEFNKKMMETIYLASVTASNDLAKERMIKMEPLIKLKDNITFPFFYDENFIIFNSNHEINKIYHELKINSFEIKEITDYYGAYSTFELSPMSQGLFQFNLWDVKPSEENDNKWNELRCNIIKYGIRNSLLTALMPTASTSQILGNNECFEFFTNNIYTRRTLAGDFPLVNKYLIDDLYKLDLWNNDMKQMILANNGSISNFSNIPKKIRRLYQTIWEIKQIWVLKNALARSPFVDQTQSLNIFMSVPDYQKLYSSHFWAWNNGLKTGIYYLRSKPAKEATKFTVDNNIIRMVSRLTEEEHFENEVCESCSA